jgi:hypothetical protein
MIPRRPPSLAAIATALGVPSGDVVDREGPPIAGARASLMHAFEVTRAAPSRSSRVQVLPYGDPAWSSAVSAWLEVEATCVRAWWTWVRDGLGRDANGVWRVPPLVEPLADAVRVLQVADEGVALPAFVRPSLDWPNATRAGVSEARLSVLWAEARDGMTAAVAGTGVVFDFSVDPLSREDLRRRLLTDGRVMAVSSFRPFLASFRALDEKRSRVTAA